MPTDSHPNRIPLLWLLLPLAGGIALSQRFELLPFALTLALAALLLVPALISCFRWPRLWPFLFSAACLCLGLGWGQRAAESIRVVSELPPREATIEIEIDRIFTADASARSISGLATIESAPFPLEEMTGRGTYFSLRLAEGVEPPTLGSLLVARGIVEAVPTENDAQAFYRYLHYSRISYLLRQGDAIALARPPMPLQSALNASKNWIRDALSLNAQPESDYSRAYLGMMLGLRRELSEGQKDLFLKSGTMHLFAISGLHIGVIAACIHAALLLLRLPGYASLALGLTAIGAFVAITGNMPSAWRAYLMIACLWLGSAGKRKSSPLNALCMAATLCLLLDPLQLFLAGFQMSYGTVAAILLFGVPMADRYSRRWALFSDYPKHLLTWWHRRAADAVRFVLGTAWVSLAAFLTSSLFGILYFGVFPPLGALINLVALPLASLAITAGFAAILCAALQIGFLAQLFNNAALATIAIIHGFLDLSHRHDASSLNASPAVLPFAWLALAAVMSFLAYGYVHSWRLKPWLVASPLGLVFLVGILSANWS